jgi:DHA2 family multidrug resistance protein-like MFS transporter
VTTSEVTVPRPPHLLSGSHAFDLGTARRTLVMVGLLIATFMANLDTSIVNVALPQLSRDLRVSAADTVWITTAFLLAVSCTLPLAIGLGDKWGRKRLFLLGTPLFTLASLACGLSPSLGLLVTSRVVQGVAAALIFAVLIPTYRQLFPAHRLGFVLGLNAMMVAVGTCAGPTLGGLILAHLSWSWLFFINLPLGILASILVLTLMPQRAQPPKKLDLTGSLVAAIAIACFVLGIHELAGPATLWPACLLLAVSLGLGVLFVRIERASADPVLPPMMFTPRFSLAVLTAFWSFFGQGVAFVALPFLFQTEFHATPLASAALFTPWPLVIVIFAPVSGRLADVYSSARLSVIGLVIFTGGLVSLAFLGSHPPLWQILASTAVAGFGFAVFQSPNNRDMMAAAPSTMSGPAAGMLNLNRTLAQSTGAGAVSMALVLSGATTIAAQAATMNTVLLVAAAGAALAVVISIVKMRSMSVA